MKTLYNKTKEKKALVKSFLNSFVQRLLLTTLTFRLVRKSNPDIIFPPTALAIHLYKIFLIYSFIQKDKHCSGIGINELCKKKLFLFYKDFIKTGWAKEIGTIFCFVDNTLRKIY